MPFGSAITVAVRPPSTGTSACRAETFPTTISNQLEPTEVLVRLFECSAIDSLDVSIRTPNGSQTSDGYSLD